MGPAQRASQVDQLPDKRFRGSELGHSSRRQALRRGVRRRASPPDPPLSHCLPPDRRGGLMRPALPRSNHRRIRAARQQQRGCRSRLTSHDRSWIRGRSANVPRVDGVFDGPTSPERSRNCFRPGRKRSHYLLRARVRCQGTVGVSPRSNSHSRRQAREYGDVAPRRR